MRTLFIIITFFGLAKVLAAQNVPVRHFSSYCESDVMVDRKQVISRINQIQYDGEFWRVDATVVQTCNLEFYPKVTKSNDTLHVKLLTIDKQVIILQNGDTIQRFSEPEECYCAYQVRLGISTDTVGTVSVYGRFLPLTDDRFKTFPIRYITYNGDTTGMYDQYGLLQGIETSSTNDHVIKRHYKDSELVKCELFDLKGKLLLETDSYEDILNY
jgi:hypothetical protein